ncbi:MAG: hypothetical protein P1P82_02735 [Bacteroidales bacterium]|nr:hypothetical protein [Bacteroidales bacterium]MDT8431037.1 hypothetical protein [Bacteroidales bacterium]
MVFREYRTGDYEQLFLLWEELDMGGSEVGFRAFTDYDIYMIRNPHKINAR